MPFDPDAMMGQDYAQPVSKTQQGGGNNRETQPISKDDAVILKDTKDEFERTPVPKGTYDAAVEQCNFAWDKKGKPKLVVVWKISGPTQEGRWQYLHISPRSGDFGATWLKQFLARAQRFDSKGQLRSLIDFINVEEPFDEKKFCDAGIAIGAVARLVIVDSKPWRNPEGKLLPATNISNILLSTAVGETFM